jgi:tetratricopeptide (TPR) repeat protein
MKEKLLLFIMMISVSGFSQSFNVQSAADSYKNLKYSKNSLKEISDAKKYIDLAAANEQTANDPKMWVYRGKIYLEISGDSSADIKNLDLDAAEKATISFINCIKTDTKKNYEEDCNNNLWRAGLRLFNLGVSALNHNEYERASRFFTLTLDVVPLDKGNNLKRNNITAEMINFNLSKTAIKAKDNEKAKIYLQKLLDVKYNDPMIYISMSNIYLMEKDTLKALNYIAQGRTVFEENANLLSEEIRIYSLQGRYNELITKFTDAITINPDNEALYYRRASLYENKKDYEPAVKDYKKAIEMNPEYFDANYSLGILLFNQAAELANSASTIKANDEFEKAKKKYELKFKEAEPFLEKALDVNQQKTDEEKRFYKTTLNALKQLYARTGEMDKYNKMKSMQEQKQN